MESGSADANRTSMQPGGTDANRTTVTVTGCFQEAPGFNNFMLTNMTEGTPEQRAQGYRIERGRDTDQHVGKQVRVTGWVDSGHKASMQGSGTSHGATSSSAQGQGSRTEFNDYPELHVQTIERVSENCSNASGNSGR
jgi:hypothetical protein